MKKNEYTNNDLLDDLEQDIISEMGTGEERIPPRRKNGYAHGYDDGFSDALEWMIERMKTYRKE